MKSFRDIPRIDEDFEEYEFTAELWESISVEDRAMIMAESANGGAAYTYADDDDDPNDPDGKDDEIYEDEDLDEDELEEYKARNTQQRRQTQRTKDRQKFMNRGEKLRAKIERKKGSVKARRLKLRKKWLRVNRAKIKNAQRVYGGKVHSKFTKK